MSCSVTVSRSSSRRSASPRTPGSSANSPKAAPRHSPRARSSTGIRSWPVAAPARSSKRDRVQLDAGRRRWRSRRRRPRTSGSGSERAPQTRDVALQRGPGRLGRLVLPQRLTEAIDADLGPPGGDEHGQELPALQPVDRHERAIAPHLERTEHVDGEARHHGTIVAAACLRLQAWLSTTCQRTAGGRQAANRHDREQQPPNKGETTMPFVNVKLIKGVFDADQKRR